MVVRTTGLTPGSVLRANAARLPDGSAEAIAEPLIPLLDTTRLTNAPGEPRVGSQLLAEIHSADRVDVVTAFLRTSGILPQLEALRRRRAAGRPPRVLTTPSAPAPPRPPPGPAGPGRRLLDIHGRAPLARRRTRGARRGPRRVLSNFTQYPMMPAVAAFQRPAVADLAARLSEPRRFLQVLTGPRQVGKTTLVLQVLEGLGRPHVYASADEPTLRDAIWLRAQWERARVEAGSSPEGAVLAVDEVQKVEGWSETVKRLWDEDTRSGLALQVVLLGSSALLVQQGLTESLAGRFEVLAIGHWTLPEMRAAFGFTLEQYTFFGGYPGAAPLVADFERWRRYVLDSLIETTVSRDILLITRVHRPALLRRLFDLGCAHSGQVLSYTKMLGQLQDAGNTTTLAHYLDLLTAAGLLTGLSKFAGNAVRQRGSSPKLQVFNTALQTATSGLTPAELSARPELRGHLIESLVGTHLVNAAARGACQIHYWRDRNREVDFVVRRGATLLALEVKSVRPRSTLPGLAAFLERWPEARPMLVGGDGIELESFLSKPIEAWLGA